MTDQQHIPKSLTDEILDEMFATLSKREEFDKATVDELKQLAQAGELKKASQVTKAIKL
jgi:soluble cytochrome b562